MPTQTIVKSGGLIIAVVALLVGGFLVWRFKRHNFKGRRATRLASSLRDEKRKSDIILQAIDDGVLLIDDQKTIQLFNPAASTITGWSASDATGLDYHTVLKLVDAEGKPYSEDKDPLAKVFASHTPVRDNAANVLNKSGKPVSLSLNASPLLDGQQVTGAVAIFRDVSDERRDEQRRAEFISTASHEMRTPVAAIEGYLALALNENVSKVDSKARDFLNKAHSSTQHLGQLFQDLLTSAKAEDGRLTSHPLVMEMGSYLEQLTNDLRFGASKKGLSMEFVLGTPETAVIDASRDNAQTKVVRPLYYVNADPDRMREVLTNLFDNAVKYTDAGKVSVGLTGNDSVVQIYVRDTGSGIPSEDIPHLFQKFYRVDSSATRTIGGTGLGLFICRKIIELYSGRIWVESEVGRGSTFFINLPRLNTQQASEMQVKQAGAAPSIPSLTGA